MSRSSGVLIAVCVKDETRMLILSMIWHLLLGADHYFVCDNSSPRSTLKKALRYFEGSGLVTSRIYPGYGEIQQLCYDDALEFARSKGYKWQGGLDTDEFTVLSEQYNSLEHALDHFAAITLDQNRRVGAIGFNWLLPPPYKQVSVHYPEDLFTTPAEKTEFSIRKSDANPHVKSFVLTDAVASWSHVHIPRHFLDINSVTVNTAGAPLLAVGAMFEIEPAVLEAAVVHSRYRTMQELAAKRQRGRATLDCESTESLNNTNCAEVHNARNSRRKVSELAQHYLELVVKGDSTAGYTDEVRQNLQPCYHRLAHQVKRVLSKM